MTDSSDDRVSDQPAPLFFRLAHVAPTGYLAIASVSVFFAVFTDALTSATVGLGCVAVQVILVVACGRHRGGLCGICASMTPLDVEKAVIRYSRDLRRAHNRWYTVYFLIPVLAASVLGWFFPIPTIVGTYGFAVLYVGIGLSLRAWNRHIILAPWCPYCGYGWGDGGDHEIAPIPDPTSTVTLPR